MHYWIVAYDIHVPRRRARVARCLEQAGIRLQKSVFLLYTDTLAIRHLIRRLNSLIDPQTDQIAAWQLSESSSPQNALAKFPVNSHYKETLVW